MFFELFRDEDPSTAGMVVQALDKDTIRRLMKPVPAQLRFTLNPEELLAKLDITGETDVSALTRGITILLEEPSGNYIIDEPYIHRMYQVVATRGRPEARDMVRVLQETPFPLEGFIQQQGRAAVALLDNDPGGHPSLGTGERSVVVPTGSDHPPAGLRRSCIGRPADHGPERTGRGRPGFGIVGIPRLR